MLKTRVHGLPSTSHVLHLLIKIHTNQQLTALVTMYETCLIKHLLITSLQQNNYDHSNDKVHLKSLRWIKVVYCILPIYKYTKKQKNKPFVYMIVKTWLISLILSMFIIRHLIFINFYKFQLLFGFYIFLTDLLIILTNLTWMDQLAYEIISKIILFFLLNLNKSINWTLLTMIWNKSEVILGFCAD